MIEAQQKTDYIEQFMVSSSMARCSQLPDELRDYHLKTLESSPAMIEVRQGLGLTVQALLALDDDTFQYVMWEMAKM